ILVVDDNPAIHEDFAKILAGSEDSAAGMSRAERVLFGDGEASLPQPSFQIDFALQGRQAVEMAESAPAQARHYALAFVDMRMPPGWDGLETIERLWAVDPHVQVVVCSAHSDY